MLSFDEAKYTLVFFWSCFLLFFFLKSFHAGEEKRKVVAMDKIMFLKTMVFFPGCAGLLCHVYLSRKENLVEILGNLGTLFYFL